MAYQYLIALIVTVVYVSFPPISAEGNENSFHRFCMVYKHVSLYLPHFQACTAYQRLQFLLFLCKFCQVSKLNLVTCYETYDKHFELTFSFTEKTGDQVHAFMILIVWLSVNFQQMVFAIFNHIGTHLRKSEKLQTHCFSFAKLWPGL